MTSNGLVSVAPARPATVLFTAAREMFRKASDLSAGRGSTSSCTHVSQSVIHLYIYIYVWPTMKSFTTTAVIYLGTVFMMPVHNQSYYEVCIC